MALSDLVGQQFGRLVVLEEGPRKSGRRWLCRCQCGAETVVFHGALTSGHTTSCSCYRTELVSALNRTHGGRNDAEYRIWKAMRSRCRRPQDKRWWQYGGRGITICERWHSYSAFLEDMGRRPSLFHSLDRIDNDGNYCPENCRWATATEQANNRSTNHLIEMDGRCLSIAQWSKELSLSEDVICQRIETQGWTEEMALQTALTMPRRLNWGDDDLTVPEWAARLGMSAAALYVRLSNGWSIEEAIRTPKHQKRGTGYTEDSR